MNDSRVGLPRDPNRLAFTLPSMMALPPALLNPVIQCETMIGAGIDLGYHYGHIGTATETMITKPYRRIIRPFKPREGDPGPDYFGDYSNSHLFEDDYAAHRVSLIQSYHVIERDLVRLFEYIEPCEDNCGAYSHRLFELFLRASTEFEANCKGILAANGYSASGHWNIRDYAKIDSSNRLSEYELRVGIWHGGIKTLRPFAEWATGQSLTWYQDYNAVKHNRSDNFHSANLLNVLMAMSGVLAVLFSQFSILSFRAYPAVGMFQQNDDGNIGQEDCIFQVKPPQTWEDDEYYDFDWKVLRDQPDRFQNFSF